MNAQIGFRKVTALAIATAFLFSTTLVPAAQATVIATDEVVAAAEQDRVKDRLATLLARDDVRAALAAQGIDPAEAQARVEALTPAEAERLAGRLDQLPAGGNDLVGAVVFIFVLLLITDLLGLTDFYPFTR